MPEIISAGYGAGPLAFESETLTPDHSPAFPKDKLSDVAAESITPKLPNPKLGYLPPVAVWMFALRGSIFLYGKKKNAQTPKKIDCY